MQPLFPKSRDAPSGDDARTADSFQLILFFFAVCLCSGPYVAEITTEIVRPGHEHDSRAL